jgi:Rho GTPase-activating protein 39
VSPLSYEKGHPLAPIPGSPYATDADADAPGSPGRRRRTSAGSGALKGKEKGKGKEGEKDSPGRKSSATRPVMTRSAGSVEGGDVKRTRSAKSTASTRSAHVLDEEGGKGTRTPLSQQHQQEFINYRSAAATPQSLAAALEKIALSSSQSSAQSNASASAQPAQGPGQDAQDGLAAPSEPRSRVSVASARMSVASARPRISTDPTSLQKTAPSPPMRSASGGHAINHPNGRQTPTSASFHSQNQGKSAPTSPTTGTFVNGVGAARLVGKEISAPVFDAEATRRMSPVRMRSAGKPILVPSAQVSAPCQGFYSPFEC